MRRGGVHHRPTKPSSQPRRLAGSPARACNIILRAGEGCSIGNFFRLRLASTVEHVMENASHNLKPWLTFAGCVLVIAVLYWAQAVLVPIALAILLTFVLTPPVSWLERWIGRVPAVLVAVTLVFTILGLAGWGLARQLDNFANDLPLY